MLILIDCDLESGMTNLKGEKLKPFIYGSCFAIKLTTKKEKELFIQSWYEKRFGITDKVYNTLEYIFEDIATCLMNNEETIFNQAFR